MIQLAAPHATARQDPSRSHPTRGRAAAAGLAAVAGLGVASQSRINGELGTRLHDGIAAATISFGTGMVLLVALLLIVPSGRRGLSRVVRTVRSGTGLRWWQCVGGACGAFLVIGRLGTGSALGLAAIPALAGIGTAWQQAVNGRVQATAGSALTATFVNFTVGTSVLVVALAVDFAVRGLPTGTLPAQPWLYLGGPLGMIFIGIAAAVVRRTGVLLLGLSMISGQLIGALLLDEIVPERDGRPAANIFVGIGVALIAIVIAARSRDLRPPTISR